jgi:hypothetical protein
LPCGQAGCQNEPAWIRTGSHRASTDPWLNPLQLDPLGSQGKPRAIDQLLPETVKDRFLVGIQKISQTWIFYKTCPLAFFFSSMGLHQSFSSSTD